MPVGSGGRAATHGGRPTCRNAMFGVISFAISKSFSPSGMLMAAGRRRVFPL